VAPIGERERERGSLFFGTVRLYVRRSVELMTWLATVGLYRRNVVHMFISGNIKGEYLDVFHPFVL
jgi:hypothetical protein